MQKQSRDCIECSSLSTVCDTKGVAVATVSKFPCVFTLAASTEVGFNFFIGFFSVGTSDSSTRRRLQTTALLPSARGECYYSEASFPFPSTTKKQTNAVLQNIENGIVQKACDVWVSSVGGFSTDSANIMLREFLLSFATDNSALPSGVAGVTAVYVGSGIPSQLTISFSTSVCGSGAFPFLFRVVSSCVVMMTRTGNVAGKQKPTPSATACECAPGFTGDGSGNCVACSENTYKTAVSDTAKCLACPTGSDSAASSRVCGCVVVISPPLPSSASTVLHDRCFLNL